MATNRRQYVYTCTTFTGHWPVGCAAVVIATSPLTAAAALNKALRDVGLPPDARPDDMERMDSGVRILNDGDY